MRDTRRLLELLTEKYPPSDRVKHNISLSGDGRLELCLFFGGVWQSIYLDEGDFNSAPEDVFDDICYIVDLGNEIDGIKGVP